MKGEVCIPSDFTAPGFGFGQFGYGKGANAAVSLAI